MAGSIKSVNVFDSISLIKPIQTKYNGYLFRSRLEARWAVFYDAFGIEYEYEKEGYDLGDLGWYLPDFYLPHHGWVEIKGIEPYYDSDEIKKCKELAKGLDEDVYLFYGTIKIPDDEIYPPPNSAYYFSPEGGDHPYAWCQCLCGKRRGIQFDGRAARLGCKCTGDSDKSYHTDSDELVAAFEKARSYRF